MKVALRASSSDIDKNSAFLVNSTLFFAILFKRKVLRVMNTNQYFNRDLNKFSLP